MRSHSRGTNISRQGRSRASEAGHLGKLGFHTGRRSIRFSRSKASRVFWLPCVAGGFEQPDTFLVRSLSVLKVRAPRYSRTAGIFESNRHGEFFAFPQESVLDPRAQSNTSPAGFIVRRQHMWKSRWIRSNNLQSQTQTADRLSAFSGATRGSSPARDEYHAIPR